MTFALRSESRKSCKTDRTEQVEYEPKQTVKANKVNKWDVLNEIMKFDS